MLLLIGGKVHVGGSFVKVFMEEVSQAGYGRVSRTLLGRQVGTF